MSLGYIPNYNGRPREDFPVLEAGKYYLNRSGEWAMVIETGVNQVSDGRSCIGYWLGTGDEDRWLPDGGNDSEYREFESEFDLVRPATAEEVSEHESYEVRLTANRYYWSYDNDRIVKIVSTDIIHHQGDICLGYWIDTGEADMWKPYGESLNGAWNKQLRINENPTSKEITVPVALTSRIA